MTITSEISRLQWAKAGICTAIENKWVTVWNITLDNYASCIDAIQTWWKFWYIDLLVVAWWWDWWVWERYNYWAWWGGGWWVIIRCWYPILSEWVYSICVWWRRQNSEFSDGCSTLLACRWWDGANYWWTRKWCWCPWGSWWWWSYNTNCPWWWCVAFQWHCWGNGWCCWWWWGWGAWWCWAWGSGNNWWKWGNWILNDFSGVGCYYWWGGWWGTLSSWTPWAWWCWWWNWWPSSQRWCNATYYWWWWGWGSVWWSSASYNTWWAWCQWVVIIRYKTDGSCGVSPSSTWGCKYTCWNYTIHCFCTVWTSTFTPAFT